MTAFAVEQLDLDLPALAGAFGRRLHEAGVPVTAERSARFAAALKLVKPIRWGANDWYVVPGATTNGLLKVRHGVIQEVGIVNQQLTTGRAAQLRLLRNF